MESSRRLSQARPSGPALLKGTLSRAVFALAAALLLTACRDGQPTTPGPTSIPTPAVSSPTPTPPDPAIGRELQRNGEYEEAISVYQQVIDRSPEPERPPARLSLARTYLLGGRSSEARSELETFLTQATTDSDRRVGRFLLAETLESLGDKE